VFHEGTDSHLKGIEYRRGKLDFRKVVQEKDAVVRSFRKERYADVLKGLKNVTYYPYQGRFVSRNEVKVGRVQYCSTGGEVPYCHGCTRQYSPNRGYLQDRLSNQ
jgi:pyruvate/2-oxoglutarate dehydrogenase complex dihydrolipoamide dehydrogenase (E3) component